MHPRPIADTRRPPCPKVRSITIGLLVREPKWKRAWAEAPARGTSRVVTASALLRFPVAGLGLAVALELDLALDRVAAELPLVGLDDLVAAEFARHLEGDVVAV